MSIRVSGGHRDRSRPVRLDFDDMPNVMWCELRPQEGGGSERRLSSGPAESALVWMGQYQRVR